MGAVASCAACSTRINDDIEPSNTKTVKNPDDESHPDVPSPVKQLINAKKQRRRLSVTPQHVGDITDAINDRRMSGVNPKHVHQTDKSFVCITKTGFVPYNKDKVNQDAYLFETSMNSSCKLFGVADGHGEFGHNVSAIVQRKLGRYVMTQDYENEPERAILHATSKVAKLLKKSTVNTTFSGTTLVYSLIVRGKIFTANLGDSRAVVGYVDPTSGKWKGRALSMDHKPDLPAESQRIRESGGRIAPLPGPVGEDCGPDRVWLADIDVPGLAMSRSLGDDVAHSVGVSSVPEILSYEITENDRFIVWASDGVWEFLENDRVADMIGKKLDDMSQAATDLVAESVRCWQAEEDVVDDITAVIYKLPPMAVEEEEPNEEQE